MATWTPTDVLQLLATKPLYQQLLEDALASLRHPLRQLHYDHNARRRPEVRIRHLNTVQEWFLADDDRGPFSFHRCCVMLALDPTAVRDRLRRDRLLDPPAALLERHGLKTPAPVRRAA